jgi:hypothetical protein
MMKAFETLDYDWNLKMKMNQIYYKDWIMYETLASIKNTVLNIKGSTCFFSS